MALQTHRRVPPAVRTVSAAKDVDTLLVTELLASFLDHSHEWAIEDAAARGHLYLVQTLSASTPMGDLDSVQDAMDFAAKCGHLHIVQWLHWNRVEGCTTDAMDMAAANGHLHVVQWLHVHRGEGCTHRALVDASYCGHLHITAWLAQFGRQSSILDAIDVAARRSHSKLAVWLAEHLHAREKQALELTTTWHHKSVYETPERDAAIAVVSAILRAV